VHRIGPPPLEAAAAPHGGGGPADSRREAPGGSARGCGLSFVAALGFRFEVVTAGGISKGATPGAGSWCHVWWVRAICGENLEPMNVI